MEVNEIKISVAELRPALVGLFEYIPYLEERVGGTFKFQYWDEETKELKDMEGCEESNRLAKFPDPVCDDETWTGFKHKLIRDVYDKFFIYCKPPKRYVGTKYSEWTTPEDKLRWLLNNLLFAVVHERLRTGYTAVCMKDGTYLRILKRLKELFAELPDDMVISYPLNEHGKKWMAKQGERES